MNNQFPNPPINNVGTINPNYNGHQQAPITTPAQDQSQSQSQNQDLQPINNIDWKLFLQNPALTKSQVEWIRLIIAQLEFVIINKTALQQFNQDHQAQTLPFTIYDHLIDFILPDEVALSNAHKEELITSLKILTYFLAQKLIAITSDAQEQSQKNINNAYIDSLINFANSNQDLSKLNGFFTNDLQTWTNETATQTISVITSLIYGNFLNPQLQAVIRANQKLINKIELIDLPALFVLHQKATLYNLNLELLAYLVTFLPVKNRTKMVDPQISINNHLNQEQTQAAAANQTPLQWESEKINLSQE